MITTRDRNLIVFVVSAAIFGLIIAIYPQFINENQKEILYQQQQLNKTQQEQFIEQRNTFLKVFNLAENITAENLKNTIHNREVLEDTNKVVHELLNKTK